MGTTTTVWFVQGDTFSEWKWSKASSLLWIHAKRSLSPGISAIVETHNFSSFGRHSRTGKTILSYLDFSIFSSRELIVLASSAIIQDIDTMKRAGLVLLAYYYFDFRDDKKDLSYGLPASSNFVINPRRSYAFHQSPTSFSHP
jgi:hypothetical protein